MRLPTPEWTTIGIIVTLGLLNAALYGGVFDGFDPVTRGNASGLPGGNAPGVDEQTGPDELAEEDDSGDLPGRFVPSQGRSHTAEWPLAERIEFCREGDVDDDCYASNPPSSGLHLPVTRNVLLPGGNTINIPPDPGVYSFEIPREAIPHLQEHAGVFIGYNCQSAACSDAALDAEGVVRGMLSNDARVVMAPDSDLDPDTFGLASWTRVDVFATEEYDDQRVLEFIRAHSCRFDPEGFCQ